MNTIDQDMRLGADLCADGRMTAFADHVFLLNEEGVVVARRAALEHPACGEMFFAHFPLCAGEGRVLMNALRTGDARTWQIMSKKGPLLAVLAPFGAVRLFLVLVPEGAIGKALCGVCAADEIPARFAVSEAALAAAKSAAADPARLRAYLFHWNVAFFLQPPPEQVRTVAAVERALRTSLWRMAELFGCAVRYDSAGLGFEPFGAPVDLATLRAFAAVACLCARRAAKTRELSVAFSRQMLGDATMHVLIDPLDAAETFAEFRSVALAFATRGETLRAVRLQDGRWQFSVPFRRPRIEAQGVKSFTAPPMPVLPTLFDEI